MLNVALSELCKYVRGDSRTIARLYIQVLVGRGYIKNPVFDGLLLTDVGLTVTGRNLQRVQHAIKDGEQREKEEAAGKEAKRVRKERRDKKERIRKQGYKEQDASDEARKIMQERRRKRPT